MERFKGLFTFLSFSFVVAFNSYYLGKQVAYSEFGENKVSQAKIIYAEAEVILAQAKALKHNLEEDLMISQGITDD